jgi:hypothetical protein
MKQVSLSTVIRKAGHSALQLGCVSWLGLAPFYFLKGNDKVGFLYV